MSGVKTIVKPTEALVDERVHVQLQGLPQKIPVTIKASFQEERLRFCSYGCFIPTQGGQVMVERQAPAQGMYTGFEPMGLFWSMRPETFQGQNIRLLKRSVTKPIVVKLAVFEGYLSWDELFDTPTKPLAISKVYRWYKYKCSKRKSERRKY
ncbi:bile acid-CoA:amino acid N-acyltransferase-like [Saccostrea echinata]|uniref:bile acid-CoA:amino acid N-acyltransferase-like n=1 Tax=Saccostrea echinata TaxID=191078 RepID=UPI002A8097EA|nr:bile acid-CoA:amino acid N-acyltransferase-like [Saccostrea echinata]